MSSTCTRSRGGGVPPLILPGAGPSRMGRVQHPLASWKGEEESFVESWKVESQEVLRTCELIVAEVVLAECLREGRMLLPG